MNGNTPDAGGAIRTVLRSVDPEPAAAVPLGPARPPVAVLHRDADGRWSRGPRPLTDLERKALAWDASCARARSVARAVERHLAGHAGPSDVRVDGDRVRVVLRVDGAECWSRWRAYFHIRVVGEGSRPHTLVGDGERDGVRVTVVAHGAAPRRRGRRPFRVGDATYDLASPLRDAHGDVWYFQGCRRPDGMPLLSLDGRPERCSLANVAAHLGPLSPVCDARRAGDRTSPPEPAG
ncbi:BN159_2729 family protein [Streptomyces sp. NPDC046928]|uniref:BN159_2729 family protein n=1 Tax=Streptomyces sp. NPDC046928 TaxID=3155021 RepID=UPI0033F7A1D2